MQCISSTGAFLLYMIYGVCGALGFVQNNVLNFNLGSFSYDEVIKNFTTRSAMSCVIECLNVAMLTPPCTHTVTNQLGQGRVQCTLLEAGNGTNQLAMFEDGKKLWMNGICNYTNMGCRIREW